MNRLGPSTRCMVCRTPFAAIYEQTPTADVLRAVQRQIISGVCDPCHRARQAVAVQLIRYADEIRLRAALSLPISESLLNGARWAEREGVHLKMWSWENTKFIHGRPATSTSS